MDINKKIEKIINKSDRLIELDELLSDSFNEVEKYRDKELKELENEYKKRTNEILEKYERLKKQTNDKYKSEIIEKEKLQKELNDYFDKDDVVYIRFKDIVDEVFNLSNRDDLQVDAFIEKYEFDYHLNRDELYKMYKDNSVINLSLWISDEYDTCISINFRFKINVFEELSNGYSLFDCININTYNVNSELYGEIPYTELALDIKDLYDIEIPVLLESLVVEGTVENKKVEIYNMPLDIYREAIMNCINNKNSMKLEIK